ncbi:hypothetical protein [Eoetvoesiella caeni]|uniref:Uncharacterized protein n=1 Tax=Eoetvoesiella caeni TaxID=645616 RepID=A0A366HAN2_9BURK|nr:hypothetical protein [Eoetvoesiella caeni]MCI2809404.1 hypothetical protein [Eoetvoesiella caeni]NYT54545.1 hypothetical protein [Eoetvoesiella caeni]RBP39265.1 hypothetical protein DFR37_10556 [Eoetvoesiella caeni]
MAREAQIIGHATDYDGAQWDVREARDTALGFKVLIGWPSDEPRGPGGRGVATIITVELAQYLQATRLRDTKLPIGITTIKRLRSEVGVAWSWDDWWAARADDLRSMTLETFCSRHGCSIGAASQRRAQLKKF